MTVRGGALVLVAAIGCSPRSAPPPEVAAPPLEARYFRIPVCHKCDELEEGVLAEVSRRYAGRIRLRSYDLSRDDDYLLLTRLEREMGVASNQAAVVIVGRFHLAGEAKIVAGLESAIETELRNPSRSSAAIARGAREEGGNPHGLSPDTLHLWIREKRQIRLVGLPCGLAEPEEKLPGALVMRADALDVEAKSWSRREPVVLYCCRCIGDVPGAAGPAIVALRALGFEKVFYLQGHLRGWKMMGYPTESVSRKG